MSVRWTEEQKRVIDHRQGNLLVSAAAGSGKTAVLVSHVIGRLTDREDPVSLSELVIMTFTEAAALEMRDRIKAALEEKLRQEPENGLLIREAGNIQNANISTIDAFCKRLITENYAVLDLDPSFRIGNAAELRLMKSDLIKLLMEEHYAEGDADYLRFVDSFTRGKEDAGIEELILRVHEYAEANPWPEEYLNSAEREKALSEEYLLSELQRRLLEISGELARGIELCMEENGPEEYLPMLREDQGAVESLCGETSLHGLIKGLSEISFSRLKATKSAGKEAVSSIRNEVKKEIQGLQKRMLLPEEEVREKMERGILDGIRVLLRLTLEFRARYQEEKQRRRMLDFSDLEHKALELLYEGEGQERRPSRIADDYAISLREILVDEYQDSNLVQEELIRALSGERFGNPNVFQVGDIKQSIYSFRLARPDLFLSKYHDPEYPVIELSENFRSRGTVLDAANGLFDRLMRKELGGIDYTEEVSLHRGRPQDIPEEEERRRFRTELMLAEYGAAEALSGENAAEAPDRSEAEARMIAKRIRELRQEGYAYRDMVILLRAPGGWAETLVETLGMEGIPAYASLNEGFFTATEVETILALLNVIDNPRQSIPLAAVMSSPIYGFTDAELAEIVAVRGSLEKCYPGEKTLRGTGEREEEAVGDPCRQEEQEDGKCSRREEQADGKCSRREEQKDAQPEEEALPEALLRKLDSFYANIRHFRELSHILSIHELLYRIYEETGYYHYAAAMPAGKKRKANLDQLIDSALSFEESSYKGLFDYIRFIERLKKSEEDQGEASVYSEQEDLVRILSIHKSKGLQFPVVFLSGLNRRFNKQDLSGKVLIDPVLGIGTDYIDPEKRLRYPSLQRMAIREKLEGDQLGEELRVLYVGMTRAEEKLIMTASCPDLDRILERLPERKRRLGSVRLRSAASMLDWILMAEGDRLLKTGTDEGPIHLRTVDISDYAAYEEERLLDTMQRSEELKRRILSYDTEASEYRETEESLSFRYPHEEACRLFPKHSVSEIKERALRSSEEGDAAGEPEQEEDYEGKAVIMQEPLAAVHPGAQEKGLSARIGDAYHHALAAYDYEKGIDQLRDILPEEEAALIRKESFLKFLGSELGECFKNAQKNGTLFREQHFMKELPYSVLFPESGLEEPVLLQGIIDAFIMEKDGILLVDYKTDRVRSGEELIRRYSIQLSLYAMALEEITGLPVRKRLIYSVPLGKTIEL